MIEDEHELNPEQAFTMRRDRLIEAIALAFRDVQLEDGITLHQAIVLDDYGTPAEEQRARLLDTETDWRDISDRNLLDCPSALSFLDQKGFLFYLPALMTLGLRHFYADPQGIRSSCEYHLTRDYPQGLRRSQPAKIAQKRGFSPAQVAVVAQFLRLVADVDLGHEGVSFVEAVERWEALADRLNPPS
ncbi:MAG: hypothetical protein EA001_13045 [Oscillatoriales cyanobacterium]|nr:MAG: hypothetical protein EA001_13045 [Oscillatoriales cyanobacterium]